MVDAAVDAYVAFTEAGGMEMQAKGQISPNDFAGGSLGWVPLKDSLVHAIDAIVMSGQGCDSLAAAATNETTVLVLHISLNKEQALNAFRQGTLTKAPAQQHGWRWHAPVQMTDFRYEWIMVNVAALGINRWAERALGPPKWCQRTQNKTHKA